VKKSITTQEDIKKLIIDLEQEWPVDKWLINDIHIWPYIRIKIYIHLLVQMNNKNDSGEFKKSVKKHRISPINYSLQLLKVFPSALRLTYFFFSLKKKKLLFFGSHFHRVLNDDKYFNRFYDSMVSHHQLEDDVYMVEYQRVYEKMYNQKAVIKLKDKLNDYTLISKVTSKFSKTKLVLENYNDFYLYVSTNIVELNNLKISTEVLVKWANKIKSLNGFYRILYKRVKPSKIIFLGYYGLDDLTAALFVGNELKIKTIDFQHGPQTNIHMAYTCWTKLPQKGFNTMPVEFWNWDLNSKSNIEEWADKTQTVTAKIVGQPYISYYLNKFQNITDNNERKIFYSLQTKPFSIEDMITPKIILLIKNFDYKWILRLHPRNNINLLELNEYLILNNIVDKTIIEEAFQNPLPDSLNSSVLHVTNYSGCLIEAYLMGIPTLLIHNIGKEMFSSYIDEKKVFYLDQNDINFENDFSKLVQQLETEKKQPFKLEIHNPLS